MSLTEVTKRQYRKIAHHLNPVVTLSDSGVTSGVLLETQRALLDHELIKIKLNIANRDMRFSILSLLCEQAQAELIQSIGKTGLLFKKAKERKERLSNLVARSIDQR
ncbi:MAG: YhbY family RNA-binding protein [Endozoicomonadaceae bacterium]|nr:YhbY family RNA-binding protein [Endozoicomonadaceae bacterium]